MTEIYYCENCNMELEEAVHVIRWRRSNQPFCEFCDDELNTNYQRATTLSKETSPMKTKKAKNAVNMTEAKREQQISALLAEADVLWQQHQTLHNRILELLREC